MSGPKISPDLPIEVYRRVSRGDDETAYLAMFRGLSFQFRAATAIGARKKALSYREAINEKYPWKDPDATADE